MPRMRRSCLGSIASTKAPAPTWVTGAESRSMVATETCPSMAADGEVGAVTSAWRPQRVTDRP